MKIGIDIRTLSFRKGGISQYTYSLLKSLVRIDLTNMYYLFNYNKSPYDWDTFRNNVREITLRLPQRYNLNAVWENILVPTAIKKFKIDLWFGPDFVIPRNLRIPSIVTVHDLLFKESFNSHSNKTLNRLSKKVNYSLRKAARVIVPSSFTRDVLQEEYNIGDSKIAIIPEAADERFHTIKDKTLLQSVLQRYGIRSPYILFAGETSRRKNLIRLLHAYHILKTQDKLGNRKLLIVGKRTIDTPRVIEAANRLNLSPDVVFTGYIADDDLPFLYNGSDIFVFPSLYEGFGIPPLEAMQCGTPVAASCLNAIREVVGEGALLFDPNDERDIADKVDQIINNKINVKELLRKGKNQAQKFSWKKAAVQTLAVFESLL
jgi:glycosyltransferase involved in cell wall biosynthesis